jgi:chemotaxis protein CheZ
VATPENELNEAIDRAIKDLRSGTPSPAMVEKVVALMRAAQTTNQKVFQQVAALSDYIANARKEIAALQTDSISGEHIPTATDELDAVVSATEEATHKIMDYCDTISSLSMDASPEINAQITDNVTKIFEACNFQDITGQRITKVVRTLKHIEGQVGSLLGALEATGLKSEEREEMQKLNVSKATDPEKHLLNGPQMTEQAIKQDEIDKLFG